MKARLLGLLILFFSYFINNLNGVEFKRANSFECLLQRANSFRELLRTISHQKLITSIITPQKDSKHISLSKKDKLELEKILKILISNSNGAFQASDQSLNLDAMFFKLSKFICLTKENKSYSYALRALKIILRNGFAPKNFDTGTSSLLFALVSDQFELAELLLEFGVRITLGELAQSQVSISKNMKHLINSYKDLDQLYIPESLEEMLNEYLKNKLNKEVYSRRIAFELLMHNPKTAIKVLNWYSDFDHRVLILEKTLLFRDLLPNQSLEINSKTLVNIFISCCSSDIELSYLLFKLAPILREFYDDLLSPLCKILNLKGFKQSLQVLLEINPNKSYSKNLEELN